MTGDDFARLLNDFTLSAESGDGPRFASHFTEDAIYYDYKSGRRGLRGNERCWTCVFNGPSSPFGL